MLLAQHMADLRQSGDGLQARDEEDGGRRSGRDSPLLGSDFDSPSEERSIDGEAAVEAGGEALREEEVGGLSEDQGTTEDEGREVQTPGVGHEGASMGRGVFRMLGWRKG